MRKKILSVGHMEFPLGLAQVQRQLLLAKAIQLEGYEVTVLCRYGIHDQSAGIESEGVYEGVKYSYCSGSSVRPANFIKRNLLKFRGLLKEIEYYRKYSKEKQLAGALVSTNNFHNILFYFFLGKIFGVNTVVDNVEYWTSNNNFRGIERFDKLLYDKLYYHFSDRVICISDFLLQKIKGPRKDQAIKIPAITDFEKFVKSDHSKPNQAKKYFLYCGSEHYFDVIDFVISAYELTGLVDVELVLITKKTDKLLQRLENSRLKDQIRILQNIPYNELVDYYIHSEALIIPLRDIDQDKARFPHKISEYCAASRPIVTDRVGEMNNYFDDSNSYLCDNYDQGQFAVKLKQLIAEPDIAAQKSEKSFNLGLKEFNYSSYSKVLVKVITEK